MDSYAVEVVAPDHPVCAGVGQFDLTDELYLCPVFEEDVVPLLSTPADLTPTSMISTYDEVRHGDRHPADDHPPGSRLLGWAKVAGRSPLVYLLPGHGPATMTHPSYRRLLVNSIGWVAGADAHAWAAAAPAAIGAD
jgi:type 1 glutamine amidotransferase